MTKNKLIKEYPWYSVDSSTWNIGQRFGVLFYYDAKDFGVKAFRLQHKMCTKEGVAKFLKIIFPKIKNYIVVSAKDLISIRSNSKFIDIVNVYAFLEQEKQLTRLWEKRGVTFTL